MISYSIEIFDNDNIIKKVVSKNSTLFCLFIENLIKQKIDYTNNINILFDIIIDFTKCKYICLTSNFTKIENGDVSYSINDNFSLSYVRQIALMTTDINNDKRFLNFEINGIISMLSFPLIFDGICLGQLYMTWDIQIDETMLTSELFSSIQYISKMLFFSKNRNENVNVIREVDEIKDRFLSTMSHELRTPLNGIVGILTLFHDSGPMNDKQRNYLNILSECSYQLMNLLANILDFSKLNSGRLTLLRNSLDINKVLKDVICMFQTKINEKKLTLIYPEHINIPLLIGDSQRLTQVLTNLLNNAVRFTDDGKITINVKFSKEKSTNEYIRKWNLQFEVEDTGIGIPLDEHEKIFEVFHQSKSLTQSLARSGTGLGLSIAKEIVRLMGGKISCISQGIGKGAKFIFSAIFDEELIFNDKDSNILRGANILVVDDRSENRIQLTDLLLKWECIPTTLSSGEEALVYLKRGKKFDCAILDICMPYMSGIELAQQLRENWRYIPLIGLSSVDLNSGIELFDHYISKPIDQTLIFPALLSIFSKKKGEVIPNNYELLSPHPKRERKLKSKLKILIAEDNNINAFTMKEMLLSLGYENITTVCDGEKCIEQVQEGIIAGECYDVILMDIIMPKMDGLEATRYIRQIKNPPYIIAVSAASQNDDKARCQSVGIDSFLMKPLLKEKLEISLEPLVLSSPYIKIHK